MKTARELNLPISAEKLVQTLKAGGVKEAYLFGSYARGEQTTSSDLDLLVRVEPGVDLFDIIDLEQELTNKAGVRVEIATKLNRHFAPYIEPELVKLPL